MSNDDRMKIMEKLIKRNKTHSCAYCEEPTYCAMESGKSVSTCWCVFAPYKPISIGIDDCLCKSCLTKEQGND